MLCDDFNDKYFSIIIAHSGDHRVIIIAVPNFKMAASCSVRCYKGVTNAVGEN